jgi:radical SAM protein with 4Fe4S-binding SPASM domain
MLILRRESFGGMLVDTDAWSVQDLSVDEYGQRHSEATTAPQVGNVRIVDVTEKGYPLLEDALSSPATLFLDVTNRCNSRCVHCYAGAGESTGDELSLVEIETLLQDSSSIGTYYVRLTGGEPTVHEGLFDIVDVIVGEGMIPSVNTNGLCGGEMLCDLVDRGVRDLRISLDGPEEVNDAIRGTGSYQKTMSSLRGLAEHQRSAAAPISVTINVVLMKATRHCLPAMARLAVELGFRLSFGLLRPIGRAHRADMLSPEQVLSAARQAESIRAEYNLAPGQLRINFDLFSQGQPPRPARPYPVDGSRCPMGTVGIGVTAHGQVVACNYLRFIEDGRWLGESICGRDLLQLWHQSPALTETRKARRSACAGCSHHGHRCNGGCPMTAYVFNGDFDARDPYCARRDGSCSATG